MPKTEIILLPLLVAAVAALALFNSRLKLVAGLLVAAVIFNTASIIILVSQQLN